MTENKNILLGEFNTPHATVPFDSIKLTDIKPALIDAMRQHDEMIASIIDNEEDATFYNTIVALDNSDHLLNRVESVFENMLSTDSNDELEELATEMMPLLSEHSSNIVLNKQLFDRVKRVYKKKDSLKLNTEEAKLLEDTYLLFARCGGNLKAKDKGKYRKLNKELSQLTLQFQQNCLKNNNAYQLLITDKNQLAGLPDTAIEAAKETAEEKGESGYMFTLKAPSYLAFMRYAQDRNLRKKMFMAYNTQGIPDNGSSNIEIIKKIVNLRLQRANLLGYNDYASFVLQERMAMDEKHVYNLLDQLTKAYKPTARQEDKNLRLFAKELMGEKFIIKPWDRLYFSNKLKEKKYNIDQEMLRPYFVLDNVKKGVFDLATRLYGLKFKRNTTIQGYNKDVEVYEVFDNDGRFIAVLYMDFFPRDGKQAGAWTSSFANQWKNTKTGEDHRPQVIISCNFNKSTASKPALLTFDEVTTLLHEFGHALHAMLSDVTYSSLSGTNVYWDFVELPSQFMENFALEKEFLHTFALHYETNEMIPDEYIQRIIDSKNYQIATMCLGQVAYGLIDMSWHTIKEPFEGDVIAKEKEAKQKVMIGRKNNKLITGISTHFSHIFCGGYAAGYYSYKWAEVLDADAFSLFKKNGIFDKTTAQSFRKNILSKGGTEAPMTLYKRFRGQEPTIDALLTRDGIKKN